MPRFSAESEEKLSHLHPDLVRVLREAIKHYDFKVLDTHRGEEEQNRAYKAGHSMLKWPESLHNRYPAEAVDLAPWPIDWFDTDQFCVLAGVVLACASHLGVHVLWGGTWERFKDRPHFQLVRPRRRRQETGL